jgi:hypothetical protein
MSEYICNNCRASIVNNSPCTFNSLQKVLPILCPCFLGECSNWEKVKVKKARKKSVCDK